MYLPWKDAGQVSAEVLVEHNVLAQVQVYLAKVSFAIVAEVALCFGPHLILGDKNNHYST